MAEELPQANAVDLVQAAREMVRAKGAPNNAENLNRAMLAIVRGQETTDFDTRLDRMANGDNRGARGSQGASTRRSATARSTSEYPQAVAAPRGRKDVSEYAANRPRPSPGNTTTTSAQPGVNENKPPETARAGDDNRNPATPPLASGDMDVRRPGAGSGPFGLNLFGDRVSDRTLSDLVTGAPGGGKRDVPGTNQLSGSTATRQTPGTAQAATPASGNSETGTPDATPNFRQGLIGAGYLGADGNVNFDNPTVSSVIKSMMGMAGGGLRTVGGRGATVAEPPGTGLSPRGPDATAYPMGGPDGRIVQLPQLGGPPQPSMPGPTVGQAAIPGGGIPSNVPTIVPRTAPVGNPNTATPPDVIRTLPERGVINQGTSSPIGQPRLQTDVGNTGRAQDTQAARQAVINEMIRRGNEARFGTQ